MSNEILSIVAFVACVVLVLLYGKACEGVSVAKDTRQKTAATVSAIREMPAPMPVPQMVATLNREVEEKDMVIATLQREKAELARKWDGARKFFVEAPKEGGTHESPR